MQSCSIPLAFSLPAPIGDYLHWWVAGIVVIGGLLLFGLGELARLRFSRVWAISSVCFAESIRRKVLLVTPLGILGVIAIALLQHPVDQQEAMRQSIKFCLFASGTLVTITAIILACTNLPREIENRVIYTIVTKPTTRLEIVLGKVIGFVRVSGLIVLIMGLFTFAFLEWQNWQLSRQVAERLQNETDPSTRRTLQGYREAGLLSTQSLERPADFQIYGRLWKGDWPQFIPGGEGYSYLVPFALDRPQQALLEGAAEDSPTSVVFVVNTLVLKRNTPTTQESNDFSMHQVPMERQVFGPAQPGQDLQAKPIPQIEVELFDAHRMPLIPAGQINGGKETFAQPPDKKNASTYTFATMLTPDQVRTLLDAGKFYVSTLPLTATVEYEVTPSITTLVVEPLSKAASTTIKSSGPPRFISHSGRYGPQIVGDPKGNGSAADFRFENVAVPAGAQSVEMRFRAGITRGGDYDPAQPWSVVRMLVYNRDTKQTSPNIDFHPETNRDLSVPVPAQYVAGGNFDVFVLGMDNGQWVGMGPTSVQLISAEHSFIWNLAKSLLLLWMFSVLVVVVAVFSSTFLSWPIAIMLTLFILLGHWGVEQLGDALNPGIGRSVATDLGFGRNAAQSQVISTSVDSLAHMLSTISSVLPDPSSFPVMDDITRGVSIPPRHLLESIGVLLYYALPMLVLGFIILKNKEVAP
jgi:ABC-type transport system involved in multi-copper enzyme maturation permease subunit